MYCFDLRGTIEPFSFLEICKRLKSMSPGDWLEVVGGEPELLSDLQRILPEGIYKIEPIMEIEPAVEYRLKIKKN